MNLVRGRTLRVAGPSSPVGRAGTGTGRAWAAFGVLAVAAFTVILYEGRGLTFFYDEWTWILERRDPTLASFLESHAGHLSLVPVALYQGLFHTFGIESYVPFRIMVAAAHLGVATVSFAYLRRRVSVTITLLGASIILLFGAAWQVLLWPFETSFALSVVGGIAAFSLVDRRTRRADLTASVAVGLALASSGIGLPFAGGLSVDLAARRDWRRLWIVAVPGVLYALWSLGYGERTGKADGILGTGRWLVEFGGTTLGAVTGTGSTVGQVLLVPFVALCVWGVRRADRGRRPRAIALMVTLCGYWVLVAISRSGSQGAGTSRYLYAGGVLVVLVIGECVAGLTVRRSAAALLAIGAAWVVAWNAAELHDGRREQRRWTQVTLAEKSAIEIAARTVGADDTASRHPSLVEGRGLVAAFDELGSPVLSAEELRSLPERYRRVADGWLAAGMGMFLVGETPAEGPAPALTRGSGGLAEGGSCVRFDASPMPGQSVPIEVRSATPFLRIEASANSAVEIRLRAFASDYFATDPPFAVVPEGEVRDLPTPRSAAPPWRVGFTSDAPFIVCGAGR